MSSAEESKLLSFVENVDRLSSLRSRQWRVNDKDRARNAHGWAS